MRLNPIHYVFAILCCNLISCQNNVKHQTDIKKINQITLIFKSTPAPWKVHLEKYGEGAYTMGYEVINYIDDNFIGRRFLPDTLQNDTLRIKTNRKWVEFIHTYNLYDKLSYIFQNGDSVIFTYRGKKPVVSVLNRKTKDNDVNFDLNKKETLYPKDYPSFTKIQGLFNFLRDKNIEEEITLEKYLQDFNNEKHYLDSLKQNNLISDTIYNFYKTQSIYQYKIVNLKSSLGLNTLKKNNLKMRKLTKEDLNLPVISDKELGQINYGNVLDSRNDSLLYVGFYNDVINLIHSNLSMKVGRIESTHYVNGVADAGEMHIDYLALYDTICKGNLLSPLAINLWKFQTIQGIIENNTMDEIEKAFVRFKNEVKDTALINFVKEKYSISDDKAVNDYDLQLVNNQSEHLTFNKLLEKHKGKVIYMDFWNSGCPPCIREFEYSGKLKDKYKGKDFVQVFISSEPNKKRWLKTSDNYHLDSESYYVENRFTSHQLENMNVEYVPHYILFKKNGTQINVTRPSDKEIYKVIDKYLSE
jgi:thiol-disulfide isomerase/thioredoxin